MKKRLLALLLMAVLVFSMLSGVSGQSSLCFVATNDSVPLILSGGVAPYYSGSRLYIPHNAFDASPNGVGASYNADKNTFVLFNKDQTLIFNMKDKTYSDKNGKTYNVDFMIRSGIVYLPATIAGHFGLSVTLLFSHHGYPIVRFTNGGQVYDDGTFVAQAENLINRAVEEYERNSQSYEQNPGNLLDEEEEDDSKANVYLAFVGDAVSYETLNSLTGIGAQGAFFLTARQILENRQLVRDIYASGHTVGLTVAEDEWDIASSLQQANDALDEVLFYRSVFVLLPKGLSFQTKSYRVLPEPPVETVEQIMEKNQMDHLVVVHTDATLVITSFGKAGAALLKLNETSF